MSRPRRDRPSPRGPRRPAVRSLALAGLLPALLHLAGCSDGPTGPDPKPQPVYSLDVLGESPISATVAGTVTIKVRVRDGDGSPVAGATVHWRTDDGSGTIAPASSTTDADGIARADWTLGTAAGEQRAFARVEETEKPIAADASPAAPASLRMPADTLTLLALRETVIVRPRIHDAYGNSIAGIDVEWSVTDAGVVAVDPDGRLTSGARGEARAIARLGELADTLHIVVEPRGAITITFDDGWRTVYTNALPILREHGLPANVAVYPNAIGWDGFLDEDQLQALHDAGWSIVSHSMSHPQLTLLSDDELHDELRESRAWIEERGFRGSNIFIVPYHDWGERERAAIEEYYDAARGISYNQFWPDTIVEWRPTDPYALTAVEPEFLPYTTPEGRETLRQLLARVAEKGEYIDVFFHQIPDEDVDDFRKLVEIIAEHKALVRPFHELFGPPRVLE